MDNHYDSLRRQAILDCENGHYERAEGALQELLELLKSYGAPTASSQTMYWYLVARHKGDKDRAMQEFILLDD